MSVESQTTVRLAPRAWLRARDRARMAARIADIAVAVWYVLLTLVATAPLLVDVRGRVPDVPLDPLFQATVLERMSENLLRLDLARLYDGGFFYPAQQTLAMSDSLVGLQPLALPMGLVLGDPVLVANLLLVLTFPLAALSADALARLLTGSRVAGWVAGTAYAFAAYRFTHIGHLNLLQMWALPLAFLTLELVLRRGGWRAAIAWGAVHVFIAGTALNYLLMLAILEPLWLVVRLAMDGEPRAAVRRLVRLVAPGAAAAGVILLLLLPYVALRAQGFERRDIDTFDFSARLADYARPADESLFLGDAAPRALTGAYERAIAPGTTVMALAVIGLGLAAGARGDRRRRLRHLVPWVVLGGAAFVLSFGPRLWPDTRDMGGARPADFVLMPFGMLDTFLPLESLRSPARFAVLVLLALVVLAAVGVARLWRSRPFVRWPALRAAALGVLAVVLVVEYAGRIDTAPALESPASAAVYDWLRRQPPGAVVEVPTNEPDRWLLASTVDGHPRLNGWSGFVPPISVPINAGLVFHGVTPEERTGWIGHASRLGARYLVVHWADISFRTRQALRAHVRSGAIRPLQQFGSATVYGVWPFPADEHVATAPAPDRSRAIQ